MTGQTNSESHIAKKVSRKSGLMGQNLKLWKTLNKFFNTKTVYLNLRNVTLYFSLKSKPVFEKMSGTAISTKRRSSADLSKSGRRSSMSLSNSKSKSSTSLKKKISKTKPKKSESNEKMSINVDVSEVWPNSRSFSNHTSLVKTS